MPGGETFWFERSSEEHDGMDIWKGSHSGQDVFAYYEYTSNTHRPVLTDEAKWYVGAEIGNMRLTTEAGNGLFAHRYCPHEPDSGSSQNFACKQTGDKPTGPTPKPVEQGCEKYVSTGLMAFFNPDGENGGKPMWTGLMNNGVTTKSLFRRFDDVPDNRPREAVPGRWWIKLLVPITKRINGRFLSNLNVLQLKLF